jgi:hypothetical protein
MNEIKFVKDPSAQKDYSVDWTARLASGETIVASAWEIAALGASSNGLAIEGTPSVAAGRCTAFLKGGAVGERYRVTNRITTSASPTPRIDDHSFLVEIKHT